MKTFRFARTAILSIALPCAMAISAFADSKSLVIHEWGTFTSVQGGNGIPLQWQANQIGDLPRFVYNWFQPGLGRKAPASLMFGKGGVSGLQRMETPVLYFYADSELSADIDIQFPKGLITEWYPQAGQIGPSTLKSNAPTSLALTCDKDSRVHWQNVHVLPPKSSTTLSKLFLTDTNGSHYFAARETESSALSVNNLALTNAVDEHEKFLFYRGTGSFATPLVVTTTDDGTITLKNTGKQVLQHLFLLHVQDGKAEWAQLDKLEGRTPLPWRKLNSIPVNDRPTVEEVQAKLSDAIAAALVSEGLFPAEARAMVKTWRDAWFKEEGVRVLYILPRAWTNEILPLKAKPTPISLVRVMVGRAEIITPELQKEIATAITRAGEGNADAKEQLNVYWRKLGRFAGPANQLANDWIARNKPVAIQARN
jgi:hypothetical protein